ncbi:hypothetical protein CPB85DRAFT_1233255, partial [Mucidula mucida]
DLFLDNFLIKYIPSALVKEAPVLFPCMYLIDFETAVSFPADLHLENQFVWGHYFGDNLKYPLTPKQKNKGILFDPFALDVCRDLNEFLGHAETRVLDPAGDLGYLTCLIRGSIVSRVINGSRVGHLSGEYSLRVLALTRT